MSSSGVPTSPKAKAERAANRVVRPQSSILVRLAYLTVVISISFIMGFAGALLSRHYPPTWPGAEIVLNATATTSTEPEYIFVHERRPEATDLFDVITDHHQSTIVRIAPQQPDEGDSSSTEVIGVIVSQDGWIATPTSVLQAAVGEQSVTDTAFTVYRGDGNVHTTETVVTDTYSGITFVQIQAVQLPIVDFTDKLPQLGDAAVAMTLSASGARVHTAVVENSRFNEADTFSTALYPTAVRLDTALEPDYWGGPVYSQSGELIGIVANDRTVIPVQAMEQSLYTLFSGAEAATATIEYEPTYRQPGAEVASSRSFGSGIVVVGIAEDMPLEIGDNIVALDA